MDDLAKGRAKVIDKGHTLRIVIPGKKHPVAIFMSIFFGVFLVGGWSVGLVAVVRELSTFANKSDLTGLTFLITWLIGWTLGGLFFLMIIIWIWARREVITISSGTLKIEKEALGIGKTRKYSLTTVKNLRLYSSAGDNANPWGFMGWFRVLDLWGFVPGSLAFDYGLRTVDFAKEIDRPEASFLLGLFHEKGIDISPSTSH